MGDATLDMNAACSWLGLWDNAGFLLPYLTKTSTCLMLKVFVQGRRKGGVLVHCYAGQSRSVALVLAYLCSALRMQLPDAYKLVLSARPSARPNSGVPCSLPEVPNHRDWLCASRLSCCCCSSD